MSRPINYTLITNYIISTPAFFTIYDSGEYFKLLDYSCESTALKIAHAMAIEYGFSEYKITKEERYLDNDFKKEIYPYIEFTELYKTN